jgi:hypothetical protein
MLLRRFLVLLLVLFFPVGGGALARPNNEMPMYGGVGSYPPDVVAANEEFLTAIAKRGLRRPQGSDNMVQLGWQYYFERSDVATAMKRFNRRGYSIRTMEMPSTALPF